MLPPDDQTVLRSRSDNALKSFVMLARELREFNSSANAKPLLALFEEVISRQENRDVNVLLVLGATFILAGFLAFSQMSEFRKIRVRLLGERENLDALNSALQQVDGELQLRIERERLESVERQWIDSGVDSILLGFRVSMTAEAITEIMVKGLGRVLGADSVVGYSFANLSWPRILKQWNLRPDSSVDGLFVPEFESRLFTYVKQLWDEERVAVVEDSEHMPVTADRIPEIVELTRQWARSWVVVPFGEGVRVTGFVLVAMVEGTRVWSAAEIELIKRVSVGASGACVQSRMFNQSMQIAENDAEVSRLVELDKVKNDFIANLNHELRSPLTSIIGYLEVALEGVDADSDPGLASSLTAVQRNAQRLQVLMDNMMQVLTRDFERLPLAVTAVDVGNLLDDGVNSLHPSAKARAVTMTLRLDSPATDLIIDGDRNQLEQVFVNLISNSIKFTPRGGTVTVVARRTNTKGQCVEVKVVDTGIGIPAEDFPNVFKRFFRASTAKQAAIPGYGIGLSLVKSIVSEHRGTITFDSTVGKGTVFTVSLPVRYRPTSKVEKTT